MGNPIVRQNDTHSHGGYVMEGADTVYANGRPVARIGDKVWCSRHKLQRIATGSSSVFAEGQGVARAGDRVSCGAVLISDSNVSAG